MKKERQGGDQARVTEGAEANEWRVDDQKPAPNGKMRIGESRKKNLGGLRREQEAGRSVEKRGRGDAKSAECRCRCRTKQP